MPKVTRGNTIAPSIMIGEKAADLLRGRSLAAARTAVQTLATDSVRAGCEKAIEIAGHAPFAGLLEGPHLRDDGTDLDAYIRQWTQTLYHPVGTCAMGTGELSVVDPELKVRGVEGLRVADASVMPKVTRGNTNAPSIMIGEKAADLLRGRSIASTRTSASALTKESVR
jgi:choline dehydrogenase